MAPDPAWFADAASFLAALDASGGRIELPRERPRPVLLPSYGGTRRQPNLTALIALLLQRYGVPVLVHGALRSDRAHGAGISSSPDAAMEGMLTADVLWELGIEPATSRAEAWARLLHEGIAFVPGEALAPGLTAFAASREVAAGPALRPLVAALIDPFGGDGYRVIAAPDAATLAFVRAHLGATRGDALLFCGAEGEPFADPSHPPRFEHLAAGVPSLCAEAEPQSAARMPSLPASADAAATAAWITHALAGSEPLPPPIVTQLGCCLNGARRLNAAA